MRKRSNQSLGRLSVEAFKKAPKTPLVIVLDNIRSMNNVGAVFRNADAFLVEKIYLCGITPKPPHRDIQKTAIGATESVCWEHTTDTLALINKMRRAGILVIAVEQAEGAIFLNDIALSKNQKYALIFGNEVGGVSQEVVSCCDEVVEIPQFGTKHSLNIAVSTGLVLWDFYCKLS